MESRDLGTTGMRVTPIGLGAWAIGGHWEPAWVPLVDEQSIQAIRRALDGGMNRFGTAAVHGLGHRDTRTARRPSRLTIHLSSTIAHASRRGLPS